MTIPHGRVEPLKLRPHTTQIDSGLSDKELEYYAQEPANQVRIFSYTRI